MGKQKTPELPKTPEFYSDPRYQSGIDNLMGLGNRLTNFDFSGSLSPLQDTISLDPEVTKLALSYAQNSLNPAFNETITQLKNEAANSGSLESSTFTDALAKAGQNLNSQFQAITAQAGLEDRGRALQSRMDLFGTGLNALSTATGYAGQSQGQRNDFNLRNYENIVAKSLYEKPQEKGGVMGGLTGGAGGLMAGLALAPFTGGLSLLATGALTAGGAYMGSQGAAGTGGQLLNLGSMAQGGGFQGLGGLLGGPAPRSSASNNPFQKRVQSSSDPLSLIYGGL